MKASTNEVENCKEKVTPLYVPKYIKEAIAELKSEEQKLTYPIKEENENANIYDRGTSSTI